MVFIFLLVLSLILKVLKKEKKSFLLLFAGIFWILVVSSTPLPQWFISALESQYIPIEPTRISTPDSVHILILGGGHSIAPELPSIAQLSSSATNRLAEGIRLYRQIPNAKIIGSGYSVSGRQTHAQTLTEAAVQLGVLPTDTLQNRTPANTEAEIDAYLHRFGRRVPLILVTSAYHMPRAMMICKRNDLQAAPAPTDFYLKRDPKKGIFNFIPTAEKLLMFERAMHEYGGIIKLKLFTP